tara:strand:- start:4369 stop:4740 length:372 start_codon:yes stop_codon:yes gene_type:complete
MVGEGSNDNISHRGQLIKVSTRGRQATLWRLPLGSSRDSSMTVVLQPRKINNTMYDMPTVDGLDRCEINTKLHYLNVEMDKLKLQQSALISMRDQLDRHAEMTEWEERAKNADSLFDQMFGGE